MERKISHKVGVKVFSEAQLENVLPTYRNLFHKIEICRNVAEEELVQEKNRHYQYNFMYDNVFSILGKRGTGKTSVVFTLQKMIREKYGDVHKDVVLPLIIPEVIPDNCTVLGWILAIVKEEVKVLEDKIIELENKNESNFYSRRCRYMEGKDEDGLLDRLERLSQLFYAGSYNPSNEASYYRAVGNSALQAVDYYKFAKEIANFWDEWVKAICYLHALEKRKDQVCPLIYFIFDDVDLAPEKIDEILSVIIKYLSHPNIIVITTADEELFLEVIEKRLDRNIGRIPGEWRNYLLNAQGKQYIMWPSKVEEEPVKSEDIVSKTTRMYLGKVLPTSTRYYLSLFHTAKQKSVFCLEEQKSLGYGVTEQVETLINAIKDFRCADCIGDYNSAKQQCPLLHNFMEPDANIVNFYLYFMGNTSRQIGNVYIALQELIRNLIDCVKGFGRQLNILSTIYNDFRYFLGVAIRANHELTEAIDNVDDFADEVFLPVYNQWKMYINYAYLNEFLRKNLNGHSKQHKIEIALQLYSLLVFLENLLLIMEKGTDDRITHRKKVHAVHYLAEYIEQVAFEERHVFRVAMPPNEFFEHYSNLLDKLSVIVTDEMSDVKFNMEYFYEFTTYRYEILSGADALVEISADNHKWFSELVGMLFMVYGNAYVFRKTDMEKCLVYTDTTYLTDYERIIHTLVRNRMRDCFALTKLQEGWNPQMFQEAINNIDNDGEFYNLVQSIYTIFYEKGKNYAGLGEIIELVNEMCSRAVQNPLENVPFRFCSQNIIYDIKRNSSKLLERQGKERFLREYIQKIKNTGRSLGKNAILFDTNNVSVKLEQLSAMGYYWSQQKTKIMEGLSRCKAFESTVSVLMPKNLYTDIIRVFTSAAESIEIAPFDENIITQNDIEEILANMDIAIDLGDEKELSMAVELGLQVLVVNFLQSAYAYQTISERYEEGNNLSSKSLEQTNIDGVERDTYYYHLFKLMADVKTGDDIENEQIADIRDDIIAVSTRVRKAYIDALIQGD